MSIRQPQLWARPATLAIGVVAAAVLLLTGPQAGEAMDAFGEDAPTLRIPIPALNYRMRVTDTDLTVFEVTSASIDGHIYLSGTLGKAKVSVPFDKIAKVNFDRGEGTDLHAIVTLKDGSQQTLDVNGSSPCYGEASFGNVTIPLKDLRDALFLGRVASPEAPQGPK